MIQKQPVSINFASGLDTKTDPKQVQLGKFLSLVNSIFTKAGLLQKRNGYKALTSLADESSTYLTTLNGNLTAVGSSISAFSSGSDTWVSKGTIQPMQVKTLPLIRNSVNQIQNDAAIAPNGLVCTVYTETNGATTTYKYAIADSVTGQNIISPVAIPVSFGVVTGSPRVFLLGKYFIIVFTNVITATSHLQYIAVNITDPTIVTANTDIASSYDPSTTLSWDGAVFGNNLYIAYNTTTGGQSVKVTYLTSTFALATPTTLAGSIATLMTLSVDSGNTSAPIVYVSFYDLASKTGYVAVLDKNANVITAPTQIISVITVLNLASAAQNGSVSVYEEVLNSYSYDSGIPTHFINKVSMTQAGSVGATTVSIRSVGLASKAFIVDGMEYYLAAYQSQYQPTYFLINGTESISSSPVVSGKLAYQNGGGYLTLGLPAVNVLNGNVAQVSYLFKDLISAVNKDTNVPSGTQVNGVYSQTGINLGSFTIGTMGIDSAEIGGDLHISGGFLWMYDGYFPVEHNFFIYPDNMEIFSSTTSGNLIPQKYFWQVTYEWTDNQGNAFRSAPSLPVSFTILAAPVSFTGNRTSGSPVIASVSSTANLQTGQAVSGTGIPASTFILSIDSPSQITLTHNATSGTATSTTFTPLSITSVSVDIPTLRLTYKVPNPVKVVIYRWSVAQQVYYQSSSISSAVLNDTTIDSVSFSDTLSDASILGNNILYTTGGVVEDVNAPASNLMTLFDTRLWLVDAEDPNLLWFSKQVIESTPVEMSDLFTKFIAPTTAAQGSTGPISALSVMDDKLIIFKKNAIYYMNGTGPDNTGANDQYSQPIFVTSTVGCSNQQSIVFMPQGLMFQSDKGIWLLGRDMATQYIGAAVEEFNDSLVQSAVNVPQTNQVRFTLNTGQTLMYDYYFGQWGTFAGVPAISSCIFQELHTFINSFGAVYQESPGLYLDGSSPVLLSFKTSWVNIAGLQGYQRAYFFYLLGKYLTPHRLSIQIAYDYSDTPEQSTIISPDNFSSNYGDGPSQSPYGQGNPYGGPGDLEQWRVFLARQRCQSFQIALNEIYDPSFGVPAGQGLTLSGLNLIVGVKKGWVPMSAARSVGTS